ncbi:response regulator transcription factor [Frankia sp. QA3]|uniref:response regulator n=1 Tax=Frankia sp. QA3 TaxID=710111 RepID=UPI000269C657|nr:response regulator transcription factor [Frankia sp. QA3]EIV93560.1 response regulator containing a CheY-like receiver domain and an HTH DNA-binding domain [Frankia sp. QA3]
MQTLADRPFSIVVADDHVLFRDGLCELLNVDDLVVTGAVGSAYELFTLIRRNPPDLVLLDVEIPGEDVIATVEKLAADFPKVRILILSMYDDPRVVWRLLSLGVHGYLLKTVSRVDLLSAVRAVRDDDARIILSISRESLSTMPTRPSGRLSAREQEIIVLVSQAMSNAQIARRLAITEGTVKRHLRNIYRKLGAVSRIDAVNKAGGT